MTLNPIDIKLIDSGLGYVDIEINEEGDISTTDGLDTTIVMSIFCERRADIDEVLKPSRRRGWWGNELAVIPGFEQGSKLWLLDQARLSIENVNAARDFVAAGLEWMIDDGVIDDVTVTTNRDNAELNIFVEIKQGSNVTEFRFFDALGASSLIFNEV